MINSDVLDELYREGQRQQDKLKDSITKQEAKDIANLFVYVMKNDLSFVKYQEPCRTDRKDMVLKFLGIKNEDLVCNPNIEEIRLRLSADYSFFNKIQSLFCACCLSAAGHDISIFQKFVYKGEYKNLLKYNK